MLSPSSSSRFVMKSSASRSVSRAFHTLDSAPAQKQRHAFETYRKEHFSRETPIRFRKEFAKAFPSTQELPADDLNHVLKKIGLGENYLLSKEELDALLAEAGTDDKNDNNMRMLSVSKIMQLTK